jgi:hypothetical protein
MDLHFARNVLWDVLAMERINRAQIVLKDNIGKVTIQNSTRVLCVLLVGINPIKIKVCVLYVKQERMRQNQVWIIVSIV